MAADCAFFFFSWYDFDDVLVDVEFGGVPRMVFWPVVLVRYGDRVRCFG